MPREHLLPPAVARWCRASGATLCGALLVQLGPTALSWDLNQYLPAAGIADAAALWNLLQATGIGAATSLLVLVATVLLSPRLFEGRLPLLVGAGLQLLAVAVWLWFAGQPLNPVHDPAMLLFSGGNAFTDLALPTVFGAWILHGRRSLRQAAPTGDLPPALPGLWIGSDASLHLDATGSFHLSSADPVLDGCTGTWAVPPGEPAPQSIQLRHRGETVFGTGEHLSSLHIVEDLDPGAGQSLVTSDGATYTREAARPLVPRQREEPSIDAVEILESWPTSRT
ncbi:hypothetical protein ABIA32_006539 [Streptacidiphilus sp. MAP12-20]|uniref:hypothetical protein n=1 Tax=Streptacidiphilus sp. MAP12-20 TaxID=3156299 RepID=UPI0035122F76